MNILSVATFSHPDHFGGAERVITAVAERLAKRGHRVTLLTSRLENTPAREERQGVRVLRYDVDRSSSASFYRSVFAGVRSVLREETAGADVLHVHQIVSAVAALAPGSAARRLPTVGSFYAPYHREYLARFRGGRDDGDVPTRSRTIAGLLRRGDRYVLKRCDRLVVLSQFSRGQIQELWPPAVDRTVIAPAGVDLQQFSGPADAKARAAATAAFGLPSDRPVMLSVRRLVARMGLPDLIEAAGALLRSGTELHLALAGTGEMRDDLEQLAASAGLTDRVTFLGRVQEERLPELYRAASIFVLPTRALEGFGMSTAEALASGLPVVATDAGATGEVLAGLEGSVVVPAGRPDALANALRPLLQDADRRLAAGVAARRHAEVQLDWSRHVDAVEHACQQAGAFPR